MTSPSTDPRPAHRPSRRSTIVERATELIGRGPIESVTVRSIADAAKMSPTAVYYHFDSRDAVVLAVVAEYAQWLTGAARRAAERRGDDRDLGEFVLDLLDAIADSGVAGAAYFIHSVGSSEAVEALQRSTRDTLVSLIRSSIARRGAAGAVAAVAVVSLLETAAISMLGPDELYVSLGPDRFRAAVADTVARLAAG